MRGTKLGNAISSVSPTSPLDAPSDGIRKSFPGFASGLTSKSGDAPVSPNGLRLSGERPPAGRARVCCSALFGGSPIDFSAVTDADDDDLKLRIADGVDDAVAAGPNSIPIFQTSQLLVTWRSGIISQRQDLRNDALPLLLLVNSLDLLGGRRLDEDSIFCHVA